MQNISILYVTKKEVIVKILMITTMPIFMLSLLLQKGGKVRLNRNLYKSKTFTSS